MALVESAHDRLFKDAFGSPEAARGMIRALVPHPIVERLDLDSLAPVPGTFVDEALAGSQSDLLFSVSLAGRPALVYLLLEHKSYPDRWVSLQLAGYILRIWEKSRTFKPPSKYLPPVIPLVVHHGPNGWAAPSRLINLVDPVAESIPELARLTPSFELLIDDLTRASDEELLSRAVGLYAQLTAFFLRDARNPERVPQTLRQVAGLLRELWAAPDGRRAIAILMRYLCVVSEADRTEVTKAVQQSLPQAQELIMTIAEQLRQAGLQEGLQQGLQQGMQQGMQRGQVQTLRKQLILRFGELGEATLTRLESADSASLDRYAERILTASSIDELFAD